QLPHQLAVVHEVGGEIEPAARFQEAGDQVDGLGIEQAPLVVAAFRPGIGEVDVDRRRKGARQDRRQQVERLAAQGEPVADAAAPRAADEHAVVLGDLLDAEEAPVRMLEAAPQQIAPLAEADLDLPFPGWPAAWSELGETQGRRELRQAVVAGRGGHLDRLDQSSSSRPRPASSCTRRRTSWERALGITSTASAVRTTTRPSTPSTAMVPESANRTLSAA